MVWLTWRQHRLQLVATGALLAAAWVLLMVEALPTDVVKMLPWSPVLIGLFWGVPLLVKEYESGTRQLVWTQSVTRRRWLLAKFGVLGAAVSVAGLAVGAVTSAWVAGGHDDPYLTRFSEDVFGQTGVAPVGWFLFLFALGAAAGSVLRRTLPAMAVTIAVFTGVMFAIPAVRGSYAEPELVAGSGADLSHPQDAMVTDSGVRNSAGDLVSWDDVRLVCTGSDGVGCMAAKGFDQQYVYYHPESRYWRFQWTETALLVLGAVALAGLTAYRTVRRA